MSATTQLLLAIAAVRKHDELMAYQIWHTVTDLIAQERAVSADLAAQNEALRGQLEQRYTHDDKNALRASGGDNRQVSKKSLPKHVKVLMGGRS